MGDSLGSTPRPNGVASDEVVEFAGVVPAATPGHRAEVDGIRDAEVLEWRQVAAVDCLPQPELNCDPPSEPTSDITTIHSLWCRRETQELGGPDVIEEGGVARCLGVVKLINDHDVEVRRIDGLDRLGFERLDHPEHMLAGFGPASAGKDLAEGRVLQHRTERRAALPEDLLPVGDEQKSKWAAGPANERGVIECRDHGLPSAGRGHDEVSMSVVSVSLHHEVLEHSTLVGVRDHVEPGECLAEGVLPTASLAPKRMFEAVKVSIRRELLERVVAPVGVECRAHPIDDRGCLGLGEPHVPFEPCVHR